MIEPPFDDPLLDTEHEQTWLEANGRADWIDAGLALLIRELWLLDIDTLMSCEENRPGIAWIEFTTVQDLEAFLVIVATYQKGDCIYSRAFNDRSSIVPEQSQAMWEYQFFVRDLMLEETDIGPDQLMRVHHPGGEPEPACSVSLRFPRGDMPLIVRRLRRARRAIRPDVPEGK